MSSSNGAVFFSHALKASQREALRAWLLNVLTIVLAPTVRSHLPPKQGVNNFFYIGTKNNYSAEPPVSGRAAAMASNSLSMWK